MNDSFIRLSDVVPRIYGLDFPSPINWDIKRGEQWCVIGRNGTGKTMLADILMGKYGIKAGSIDYAFWNEEVRQQTGKSYPTETLRKVGFESAYLLSDYKNMYYQQRFNALENEYTPTVETMMSSLPDDQYVNELCERFRLKPLYSKHLIMLSSGELRRLLIVLALAQHPQLIVFDNPFIGLDAAMRRELDDFFEELSKIQQMIFLVPSVSEMPKVTTHVLKADSLHYEIIGAIENFREKEWIDETYKADDPIELPQSLSPMSHPYQYVLQMKNINISYQGLRLFKDLNWEIRRGEKWALLGKNGSGKSTLLSLLVADNPRAYSLDITIFDRKRGTGESIWDIKKTIGYISSEMHLFFRENQSCLKIVSSGFFDTMGLFGRCSEEQEKIALQWMKLLGIESLKDCSYLKLSSGEQRLVLLARTMVKNPDLLILDEPLHGLDAKNKSRCRAVIEKFCEQKGKTMIYVTHRIEEIPACVTLTFELKKEA